MKRRASPVNVVTVGEALHMLGLRGSSLAHLERSAGIAKSRRRSGYTDREFRALVDTLRESLDKAAKAG